MSKSKLGLLLGLYAMAATSNIENMRQIERESRKRNLPEEERNRNIKNGLSEYFYGNNSLWAINKKVADKKALKRGWI